MEVHKHPHHVTHTKKWGEYFLEFLMIFLAVFLGFMAENMREHRIEKEKEEQYMQSLIMDLKKDIQQGDTLLVDHQSRKQQGDSLLPILSGNEIKTNSYPAYVLWSSLGGFVDFFANDGTIQQLKNSGAMRLIKKPNVVAKIMDYYRSIEMIKVHQNVMNDYLFAPDVEAGLFDVIRFANPNDRTHVPLLKDDKVLIGRAYLQIGLWGRMLNILRRFIQAAQVEGRELIELINKEYPTSK